MTLTLSAELERRLSEAAAEHGLDLENFAVKVLDEALPPDRTVNAVALLQSWIDADDTEIAEQQGTGDYLIRVLDEDRLSDRKLFPPELKGVTW